MDEFMFEDEVDEVGSDVEAYCPKCKADTTHVVISKYEDEIRRVQCNPCGDVHSYRKPRGEVEEDMPEPVSARKRALLKKPTWEEFFAKHHERHAKPYNFGEAYRENAMVTHPKFGVGFVSEVVSDSKLEVTFKDGRRVLVHNRKDMPGLPMAAEGDGVPMPGPKELARLEKAKLAAAKELAKVEKAKANAAKAQAKQDERKAAEAAKKAAKAADKAAKAAKAAPKAPAKAAAKTSARPAAKVKAKAPARPPAKAAAKKAPAKKPAKGKKKK